MEWLLRAAKWIDDLSMWTGKAVSFLIFFLTLIVCYEVVARYILHSPTVWTHEFSVMLFGTFIVLGGAFTLRIGGHANMNIIHERLPLRVRALLDVLTFFVAFFFVWLLLSKGWSRAWTSLQILEHASTEWAPPIYPFRLMLPLGAFLLLLQLLAKFVRDVMALISGREKG